MKSVYDIIEGIFWMFFGIKTSEFLSLLFLEKKP